MRLTRPVWNCGDCGRFTTRPDWYAPWGGAADQEPPDHVPMCEACAGQEFRRYLRGFREHGLRPYWSRPCWVPSQAWRRARAVARGEWSHGLRERPVIHARAWETDTRHEHTPQGRRVHARCVCGWTTPRLSTGVKYEQQIRPHWNERGGVSGDIYARWLLEAHIAGANGREYPPRPRR